MDDLPSCLESLVSSGRQLRELAHSLGQYYIRSLLVYGYALEPAKGLKSAATSKGNFAEQARSLPASFADNQPLLESINALLHILPLLEELNRCLEGAFETVKSALKRLVYYLNKAARQAASSGDNPANRQFQLTPDVKLWCVFVPMMDLFYVLLSLEKTIENHTNICQSLEHFRAICKQICNSTSSQLAAMGSVEDSASLCDISKIKLAKLIEFLETIQLALCKESLFGQCLEHLGQLSYTLDLRKVTKSDKTLDEHLAEFILFYADNSIDDYPSDQQPNYYPIKTSANQQQTLLANINQNLNKPLYLRGRAQRLLGLSTLIVLYARTFRKHDKRVHRSLLQLIQRFKTLELVPLLNSNSYLQLSEFLTKHLPPRYVDCEKLAKQLAEASGEFILAASPQADFERFYFKLSGWLLKFKSLCVTFGEDKTGNGAGAPTTAAARDLLRQGLALGQQMNATVRLLVTGHLHLGRPISKANLVQLLRLVALAQSIEATLDQEALVLEECLSRLQFETEVEWRSALGSIQKRLMAMKFSDRKLDTNSMLVLTSQCSNTLNLNSHQGLSILSLTLPMLMPSLEIVELNKLNELLNNLDLQRQTGTNFGFLYWNIPTFGSYYNQALCEPPCAINELRYFHRCLDDIRDLFALSGRPERSAFDNSQLIEHSERFLSKLEDELVEQFKGDFLDRVCQEFEIELRLQTHRDLNLNGASLFERHNYNFKQIFSPTNQSSLFRILSKSISLKEYIEGHLNRVSYNLTAIAPNDWFTYDKMINLAKFKYNLEFLKSQLPTQTLDYGLDLMDITRNLALFVSRYSYDLSNQLFLERCAARWSSSSASASSIVNTYTSSQNFHNQNLNVIQVKHVSKSIQTHGFGLLNSSVNCVYQAMKRLVNLFAKQLSDDNLRAILVKEHQQLRLNTRSKATMTFERANKLAKRFRLVASAGGLAGESQPKLPVDLDSLRQLVTQLGNLLGLVRMLKAGSLQLASRCVDHLPDLDNLTNLKLENIIKSEFNNYTNQENLLEAGRNFDRCLEDFNENFLSKTNYIRLIVDLFAKILATRQAEAGGSSSEEAASAGSKIEQLRLFHVLVPPLTINFIDHLMSSKERVLSRASSMRAGGLLTDDGFSMGVAFLLTVLEQRAPFSQLNWFQVVRDELEARKAETRLRAATSGDKRAEESLKQTSLLTLKRLEKLAREYANLDHILNCALLFMRS